MIPREVVVVSVPVAAAAACAARYRHRRFLHARRNRGRTWTIVVGDTAAVADVIDDLEVAPYHGYLVIGTCLSDVEPETEVPVPTLGALADIPQIVSDYAVSVVVVAGNALGGQALRRQPWACVARAPRTVVAPGLVEVAQERVSVHPTAGLSLLRLEIEPPRRRLVAKAVMDRVLGLVALTLVAPVILVAAVAVQLTSPGRAFYTQTRVGVDGREFTIWKACAAAAATPTGAAPVLTDSSDRDELMFKMARDPRITPVGRAPVLARRVAAVLQRRPRRHVAGRPAAAAARGGARLPRRRAPAARVKPSIRRAVASRAAADLPWNCRPALRRQLVRDDGPLCPVEVVRAVVTGAGAY